MVATASTDITSYLNEIGRLPVLTKEAQLLHCRRISKWVNWPEGRENAPLYVARSGKRSLDIMVRTNLRLVVSIAKKYLNKGMELQDLIQEGNIGMIRSLELYDPSRGYAFSTYAYWWIRQSINRAIHLYSRTIRIPVSSHEITATIMRYSAHFASLNGRQPSLLELAAHLSLPPSRIQTILDSHALTVCVSLDHITSPEGDTLISILPNPNEDESNTPEIALQEAIKEEFLHDVLIDLEPLSAEVIKRLFLYQESFTEVCASMHLSRAVVMALKQKALQELRLRLHSRKLTLQYM